MKAEKNQKRIAFLQLFCIFFLLIAFVLTSSMVLFLNYLGQSMGIDFAQSDIQLAAMAAILTAILIGSHKCDLVLMLVEIKQNITERG